LRGKGCAEKSEQQKTYNRISGHEFSPLGSIFMEQRGACGILRDWVERLCGETKKTREEQDLGEQDLGENVSSDSITFWIERGFQFVMEYTQPPFERLA
jgi:hypothetical protein